MRLHAYVLAGDPAWIAQSIGSYYGIVDRIVVSYDAGGGSWGGAPLSVDESLARMRAADPDGKMVFAPGDHSDASRPVMTVETEHRQAALDAASEGADWVVQLDTDEIVPSTEVLLAQLRETERRAAGALAFPMRNFHARTPSGAFLEHCGRFWTTQSGYPGPVVVRAGTRLTLARQAADTPVHRVDVSPRNTDPAHPFGTPVHAVIPPSDAIVHMSWVRTEAQMAEKRVVSGYAPERDWDRDLRRWRRRAAHPLGTALVAPFARNPFGRFRITRLPEFAEVEP
ncbi:hypothetical protein ARHIZOSPH14_16040 [Agromyces rhizosphaerae]|uniref:Glycosyl transferase family 2 n=1 Tax=Agromyces rhizosphaerae TaxID=88374 RepID=A0A9W6FR69_9MICO|nr:hypothetical protein [Agromyces rhizosphaerae]GLI27362.1 hypothetical protein ARHIZOSPH14_16040 [Agromyces rhizosphaerae]